MSTENNTYLDRMREEGTYYIPDFPDNFNTYEEYREAIKKEDEMIESGFLIANPIDRSYLELDWREIARERGHNIPEDNMTKEELKEYIKEKEKQQKSQERQELFEDIKDYTFKTADTLVLPALAVIIIATVIIKKIKKELLMKTEQIKCPNCNNSINNEDDFCKFCGKLNMKKESPTKNQDVVSSTKEIDSDTIAYMEEFNEHANNDNDPLYPEKEFPLRWFYFLANYLIPLWIFAGIIMFIGSRYGLIKEYYGTWTYFFTNQIDGVPNSFSTLLGIFIIILLFLTFRELRYFTKVGYTYAIYYFTLNMLSPILMMLIYLPFYAKANVSYDFYNTISTTIANLIICVPNIIYLKKRKELFYNIF